MGRGFMRKGVCAQSGTQYNLQRPYCRLRLAKAASDVRLSCCLPCCSLCCGLMLTWMVQVPKQGRVGSPMLAARLGLPSRAALGQRQAALGSPCRQDLAGRNSSEGGWLAASQSKQTCS